MKMTGAHHKALLAIPAILDKHGVGAFWFDYDSFTKNFCVRELQYLKGDDNETNRAAVRAMIEELREGLLADIAKADGDYRLSVTTTSAALKASMIVFVKDPTKVIGKVEKEPVHPPGGLPLTQE